MHGRLGKTRQSWSRWHITSRLPNGVDVILFFRIVSFIATAYPVLARDNNIRRRCSPEAPAVIGVLDPSRPRIRASVPMSEASE